jgi:quercetin dioxygenase-like cupin family protein
MQHWDLTEPNVGGRTGPRVLFSTSEARGVVIALAQGEEMGDHQVRERALIQVLSGSVSCTSGVDTATCAEGTLILFEPGEPHSVRALLPTRLLVVLAPWPAPGHYAAAEGEDPHELPVHATQPPRSAPSL